MSNVYLTMVPNSIEVSVFKWRKLKLRRDQNPRCVHGARPLADIVLNKLYTLFPGLFTFAIPNVNLLLLCQTALVLNVSNKTLLCKGCLKCLEFIYMPRIKCESDMNACYCQVLDGSKTNYCNHAIMRFKIRKLHGVALKRLYHQ